MPVRNIYGANLETQVIASCMDLPGSNYNEIIFPKYSKVEILSAFFYKCLDVLLEVCSYYKDSSNPSPLLFKGTAGRLSQNLLWMGMGSFCLKKRGH